VDDDGPGIPQEMRRGSIQGRSCGWTTPRNQDEGGTGLGLAPLARRPSRAQQWAADIMLGDSPMGGLRATARITGVTPIAQAASDRISGFSTIRVQ